jgi:hypothetical protein
MKPPCNFIRLEYFSGDLQKAEWGYFDLAAKTSRPSMPKQAPRFPRRPRFVLPPACQSAFIHPQFEKAPLSGGSMPAVRSRNFRLSLMLATALSVSMLPTAGRAYTPEQQQACSGDAFRLCSAEIPDVDRVTVCMIRNKSQLSPGCRVFFRPEPEPSVTPIATGRPLSISPAPSRKPDNTKPRKPKKPAKPGAS